MKILMINVVCGIRSTGRICTDLATVLESQGHEVKIAYGRENVPKQYEKYAVKIGSNFDVKMHAVKARLFDGAGFGSKRATEKFIEWVKCFDPDVIHLHNIHGYYINVEILFRYLKLSRKKVIWTLHDCWSFTGHTAYCDAIECKKWINGCHHCSLRKAYPASLIDNSYRNWLKKKKIFTGVSYMTIITPSEWLKDWVMNSFLKEYPVRVINNGIDTSQFESLESDFKKKNGIENKFMLLGVSTSWDDMKGYSDFIKIAKVLEDDYVIVLVGLTKTQLETLPSNILGVERTSSVRALAEIYTAADLFLNLSYCENYPTVNIEAMACGTPVLTYKTGGSPEIVLENNGYVCTRGDISSIINKIREIRKNGTNRITLEKTLYDNASMMKKYMKVYNDDIMNKNLKVLFLTNVPSPYRVNFFNELGKNVNLTVLYQKEQSSERNEKWSAEAENNYKSIFLKGKSTGVDNAFCLEVIKYIDRSYDAIVICGNASPTEILAIEFCKLRKIPYILEGDGAFIKKGNYFKEKLKRHLIAGGDLFLSTCSEHDKYYEYYGAKLNKIVRYRFSSLVEEDILSQPIEKEEKKRLKEKNHIYEEKIILAVGQFIPRKGFDVLLKAVVGLQKDVGIYIVGDNPTSEYLEFIERKSIKNVHFVGFKTKEELKEYYKLADIFVLPTREDIWGLVINEAMAYGLPIVTTNKCNAGLELVKNGINGYIVQVGNVEELRCAIIDSLLRSDEMGYSALKAIQSYTIENMVKDHVDILKKYKGDQL